MAGEISETDRTNVEAFQEAQPSLPAVSSPPKVAVELHGVEASRSLEAVRQTRSRPRPSTAVPATSGRHGHSIQRGAQQTSAAFQGEVTSRQPPASPTLAPPQRPASAGATVVQQKRFTLQNSRPTSAAAARTAQAEATLRLPLPPPVCGDAGCAQPSGPSRPSSAGASAREAVSGHSAMQVPLSSRSPSSVRRPASAVGLRRNH
ncbi:unnamed protein product [Polarella glacialis]|uniref:Uncharacterized protein n=1 Tax=Polarella glacialis TaxID=89957 RepID=A0A813EAW0_POLGL|nr:unnamed protein product [Polarella glacialis]